MEWMDDYISIYFAHMKNGQFGTRKRDPRYICANVFDPIICPILSLISYLATFSVDELVVISYIVISIFSDSSSLM